MRNFVFVAVAAAALGACASEGQMQAAMLQCESVGVTRSDPYFETCVQANRLQANQDNLEVSYRRALNPTYDKRGLAHQWYGY